MKNDRRPTYSKDHLRRVISVANGQWQLQEHGNIAGTNVRDPWFNRGVATADYDVAVMNMGGT